MITACVTVQSDCCAHTVPIQVRNCGDFFVYFLWTPRNVVESVPCSSFCAQNSATTTRIGREAGLRNPAEILPRVTSTDLRIRGAFRLRCTFEKPSATSVANRAMYRVTWTAYHLGASEVLFTHDITETFSEADVTRIDVTITCSVKVVDRTNPSHSMIPEKESPGFYVGLEIDPVKINLMEGDTHFAQVTSSVPFPCDVTSFGGCEMKVHLAIRDSGKTNLWSNAMVSSCFVSIYRTDCQNGICGRGEFEITGVQDFAKDGIKVSAIETVPVLTDDSLWAGYDAPDVEVAVVDVPTSQCYSYTNLHILTLDGALYDLKKTGTFLMYQAEEDGFQVQARVWSHCSSGNFSSGRSAWCHCGVAAAEGGDVILIDRCGTEVTSSSDVTYPDVEIVSELPLNSGTKIVKARGGRKITVYFPSGSFLRVDVEIWGLGIAIQPTPGAQGRVKGLCGVTESSTERNRLSAGTSLFERIPIRPASTPPDVSSFCSCGTVGDGCGPKAMSRPDLFGGIDATAEYVAKARADHPTFAQLPTYLSSVGDPQASWRSDYNGQRLRPYQQPSAVQYRRSRRSTTAKKKRSNGRRRRKRQSLLGIQPRTHQQNSYPSRLTSHDSSNRQPAANRHLGKFTPRTSTGGFPTSGPQSLGNPHYSGFQQPIGYGSTGDGSRSYQSYGYNSMAGTGNSYNPYSYFGQQQYGYNDPAEQYVQPDSSAKSGLEVRGKSGFGQYSNPNDYGYGQNYYNQQQSLYQQPSLQPDGTSFGYNSGFQDYYASNTGADTGVTSQKVSSKHTRRGVVANPPQRKMNAQYSNGFYNRLSGNDYSDYGTYGAGHSPESVPVYSDPVLPSAQEPAEQPFKTLLTYVFADDSRPIVNPHTTRTWPNARGWSENLVRTKCTSTIREFNIVAACGTYIGDEGIQSAIEICVRDVHDKGDWAWADKTYSLLENICEDEVIKDRSSWIRRRLGNPSPPDEIMAAFNCPHNCFGNGECTSQGCDCFLGYNGLNCGKRSKDIQSDQSVPPTTKITATTSRDTAQSEATTSATSPASLYDAIRNKTLPKLKMKRPMEELKSRSNDRNQGELSLGRIREEIPELELIRVANNGVCSIAQNACNEVEIFGTGFDQRQQDAIGGEARILRCKVTKITGSSVPQAALLPARVDKIDAGSIFCPLPTVQAVGMSALEIKYQLQVTDGSRLSNSVQVTVNLRAQNPCIRNSPPVFSNNGLMLRAYQGERFVYQLEATDPEDPFVYFRVGDDATPGISVSMTGLVEWTVPADDAETTEHVPVIIQDQCGMETTAAISIEILPCLCENAGRCVPDLTKEAGLGAYDCECPLGFRGTYCNETASCFQGFTGPTCMDDVNECLDDPCFVGVECFNLIGSFYCGACPEEYLGNGLTCERVVDGEFTDEPLNSSDVFREQVADEDFRALLNEIIEDDYDDSYDTPIADEWQHDDSIRVSHESASHKNSSESNKKSTFIINSNDVSTVQEDATIKSTREPRQEKGGETGEPAQKSGNAAIGTVHEPAQVNQNTFSESTREPYHEKDEETSEPAQRSGNAVIETTHEPAQENHKKTGESIHERSHENSNTSSETTHENTVLNHREFLPENEIVIIPDIIEVRHESIPPDDYVTEVPSLTADQFEADPVQETTAPVTPGIESPILETFVQTTQLTLNMDHPSSDDLSGSAPTTNNTGVSHEINHRHHKKTSEPRLKSIFVLNGEVLVETTTDGITREPIRRIGNTTNESVRESIHKIGVATGESGHSNSDVISKSTPEPDHENRDVITESARELVHEKYDTTSESTHDASTHENGDATSESAYELTHENDDVNYSEIIPENEIVIIPDLIEPQYSDHEPIPPEDYEAESFSPTRGEFKESFAEEVTTPTRPSMKSPKLEPLALTTRPILSRNQAEHDKLAEPTAKLPSQNGTAEPASILHTNQVKLATMAEPTPKLPSQNRITEPVPILRINEVKSAINTEPIHQTKTSGSRESVVEVAMQNIDHTKPLTPDLPTTHEPRNDRSKPIAEPVTTPNLVSHKDEVETMNATAKFLLSRNQDNSDDREQPVLHEREPMPYLATTVPDETTATIEPTQARAEKTTPDAMVVPGLVQLQGNRHKALSPLIEDVVSNLVRKSSTPLTLRGAVDTAKQVTESVESASPTTQTTEQTGDASRTSNQVYNGNNATIKWLLRGALSSKPTNLILTTGKHGDDEIPYGPTLPSSKLSGVGKNQTKLTTKTTSSMENTAVAEDKDELVVPILVSVSDSADQSARHEPIQLSDHQTASPETTTLGPVSRIALGSTPNQVVKENATRITAHGEEPRYISPVTDNGYSLPLIVEPTLDQKESINRRIESTLNVTKNAATEIKFAVNTPILTGKTPLNAITVPTLTTGSDQRSNVATTVTEKTLERIAFETITEATTKDGNHDRGVTVTKNVTTITSVKENYATTSKNRLNVKENRTKAEKITATTSLGLKPVVVTPTTRGPAILVVKLTTPKTNHTTTIESVLISEETNAGSDRPSKFTTFGLERALTTKGHASPVVKPTTSLTNHTTTTDSVLISEETNAGSKKSNKSTTFGPERATTHNPTSLTTSDVEETRIPATHKPLRSTVAVDHSLSKQGSADQHLSTTKANLTAPVHRPSESKTASKIQHEHHKTKGLKQTTESSKTKPTTTKVKTTLEPEKTKQSNLRRMIRCRKTNHGKVCAPVLRRLKYLKNNKKGITIGGRLLKYYIARRLPRTRFSQRDCQRRCGSRGKCVANGMCKCEPQYAGRFCERSSCDVTCKNGGVCISRNVCKCTTGYYGTFCQEYKCQNLCQNGGRCVGPNTCECENGFTGEICQTPVCSPSCENGGKCQAGNVCKCEDGYSGERCGKAVCRPNCLNGGTCTKKDFCSCPRMFLGSRCQTSVCNPRCAHGGRCTADNKCLCKSGWTGSHCTLPTCLEECANGGTCAAPNTCRCKSGWSGSTCRTGHCARRCRFGSRCVRPNQCRCPRGPRGKRCRLRTGFGRRTTLSFRRF